MIQITRCPTCGSKHIKRVRRDVTLESRGEAYTVRALEFEECPDCGEKLYDHEAMQKLEAASPAYRRSRAGLHKRIDAMTPEQIAGEVKDLRAELAKSTDMGRKKRIRSALRRRGHRGGMGIRAKQSEAKTVG